MSDSDSDSDAKGGVPLIESPSRSASPVATTTTTTAAAGKRKREEGEDGDAAAAEAAKPESKRAAKRRKAKKPKDVQDDDLDEERGVNHAISRMDSSLLADHMAQRTRRFGTELSTVELEDRHIPARAIVDTSSSWHGQGRTLAELPAFLEKHAAGTKLNKAPKPPGTPHTLVVTAAGIRAADLTRACRVFQTKDAAVAKLFAKHIKLAEAIEHTKKTRMNIGVGTPQRITDLLNDGALNASSLKRIVIDASHIDQKKRGIFDMKDTLVPLIDLLTREDFKKRYGAAPGIRIDLLFF